MPATIIDDYKIFPRIMMAAVTVLTYQSVHWFMQIEAPTLEPVSYTHLTLPTKA